MFNHKQLATEVESLPESSRKVVDAHKALAKAHVALDNGDEQAAITALGQASIHYFYLRDGKQKRSVKPFARSAVKGIHQVMERMQDNPHIQAVKGLMQAQDVLSHHSTAFYGKSMKDREQPESAKDMLQARSVQQGFYYLAQYHAALQAGEQAHAEEALKEAKTRAEGELGPNDVLQLRAELRIQLDKIEE